MKKGADAHDRGLVFTRFPLLNKLQEIASGTEGKITMPAIGKGGERKGGDPAAGKNIMDLFAAVDLMHPCVPGAETRMYQGRVPTAPADFSLHSRDRSSQGSRWFTVWESTPGVEVVTLEYVGLKMSGKIPPSTGFSVLIAGIQRGENATVRHVAEEKVSALTPVKGELVLVSDGQMQSGRLLGNLLKYEVVVIELFEPDRGSQMIPLVEVNIRVLERCTQLDADEETFEDSQSGMAPYDHIAGG
jgi:hypothetical protein